jgi:hypothetical protein
MKVSLLNRIKVIEASRNATDKSQTDIDKKNLLRFTKNSNSPEARE